MPISEYTALTVLANLLLFAHGRDCLDVDCHGSVTVGNVSLCLKEQKGDMNRKASPLAFQLDRPVLCIKLGVVVVAINGWWSSMLR